MRRGDDLIRYTSMEPRGRWCQCACEDALHPAAALVSGVLTVGDNDGLISVDFWCCSPKGIRRAQKGITRLANLVCVVVAVMVEGGVSSAAPATSIPAPRPENEKCTEPTRA